MYLLIYLVTSPHNLSVMSKGYVLLNAMDFQCLERYWHIKSSQVHLLNELINKLVCHKDNQISELGAERETTYEAAVFKYKNMCEIAL